jgi:hypothetical protein
MATAKPPAELLADLTIAFEGITQTCAQLREAISQEAKSTPDLPGVDRLGPNAISVSSSKFFSTGRWSQFTVDAPKQATRLGEIIGSIMSAPATALKQLDAILEKGVEPAKVSGVEYAYDPIVIERFRPLIKQAIETGRAFQACQAAFPPGTPDKRSQP